MCLGELDNIKVTGFLTKALWEKVKCYLKLYNFQDGSCPAFKKN